MEYISFIYHYLIRISLPLIESDKIYAEEQKSWEMQRDWLTENLPEDEKRRVAILRDNLEIMCYQFGEHAFAAGLRMGLGLQNELNPYDIPEVSPEYWA